MKRVSALGLLLLLGLIACLFSGCKHDPNARKQKFLKSGQEYFATGQYEEAAIQYGNVLQLDPRDANAHYQLAECEIKLQQWLPAFQELQHTLQLQPVNYPAHLEIANLLIASHNFKDAQPHVDLLLQKTPDDPLVHITAANLLAGQDKLNDALQQAQTAVSLAPSEGGGYLSLGAMQQRAAQFDTAETNFKKAIELEPQSSTAHLALGSFYQGRNRKEEAEQQFRRAIDVAPNDSASRSALVRLYVMEGKKQQAEEFLKNSKALVANDPTGYRMLGDFYFENGDFDKALAEYQSLDKSYPQDVQVKENYARLLLIKGRAPEAERLVDDVLRTSASDSDALILRGEIQIQEGKTTEAVQSLQALVRNDPENALAHFHLGRAFHAQGNGELAESEWRQAVQLQPTLLDAQVALAHSELEQGDLGSLQQTATQIINFEPKSPEGYLLRAQGNLKSKHFSQAGDDVDKAIAIAPDSAEGYVVSGNLQLAQEKYGEAGKLFEQALARDASSASAIEGLVKAYSGEHDYKKAVAAVQAQIAKAPNSSALYDALGTAYFMGMTDLKSAENALRKAVALDDNNSDALIKLGQVQTAQGNTDGAISTYKNALRNAPSDVDFNILLGELYESKQDWSNAKSYYQKALLVQPENPLAANDMAYAIVQTDGNLDLALTLAQRARRSTPNSPNAADTLGWVLYKKGLYPMAVSSFQDAIKLNMKSGRGENPTYHYHLGLAYQKTRHAAQAKKELEKALEINPNYSDAEGVKKALAEL
jgi:tetratricopeptide (TPR) repeat protein